MFSAGDDDEYEIPLRDQRVFGAGIKRKRIHFVPSKAAVEIVPGASRKVKTSGSAADKYLSIVLKDNRNRDESKVRSVGASEATVRSTTFGHFPGMTDAAVGLSPRTNPRPQEKNEETVKPELDHCEEVEGSFCPLCQLPLAQRFKSQSATTAGLHETTLAHQIHLTHSHPPSYVDRSRLGLSVLARQGWDPDSRLGLGARGEGMLAPVKAKENPARAGLGTRPEKVKVDTRRETVPRSLDVSGMRRVADEARAKAQRLRDAFYRSEDVERYLGDGCETEAEWR